MNSEPTRPSIPAAAHRLLLLATLLLTNLAYAQPDAPPATSSAPASATNSAETISLVAPSGEAASGPRSHLDEAFITGNLAEDEDQDLPQALESYRGIVRDYDARRRRVAEALFRFGETARKLQRTDEARSAYERILSEFGSYEDLANRSRERLDAMGVASADAGNPAPNPPMSEELMRRYGLVPPASPASPGGAGPGAEANAPAPAREPFRMSAEMMRRYGLLPKTPSTHSGGSIPAEARNTGDAAPTTFTMSPELMRRYGLNQVRPPSPARSVPAPASATASAAPAASQADPRQQELAALRAEAIRLTMDAHKAKRQLRILGLHPNPRLIPAYLVEDARLSRLLEELEKTEDDWEMARATGSLPPEQLETLGERRNAFESRVQSYIGNVLVPRLEATMRVFDEDLVGIRREITALEDQLRAPTR